MKKIAVALEYSDELPKIIASARGYLAEKLLELAELNEITVFKDSDMAEVLSKIETGREIPEHLYLAVAEILAYCYKVNSRFRDKIASDLIQ